MRLIIVPQYPSKMRYQEWWMTEMEKEFSKYFTDVVILGKNFNVRSENTTYHNNFSPVNISINFELYQIKEYLNMKLYDSDILFLTDISYPGIFSNVLFHKKPNKCFCFCHGTSKNKYDYFIKNRRSKWKVESGFHLLFDLVFVATKYHQDKLTWNNIQVVAAPPPSFQTFKLTKEYDIISVSRNCIQKRNKKIEIFVQSKFGNITYPENIRSWEEYYQFVSKAKILLITSKEETFGYQVMDAVLNNCIPIAPSNFSFPELLPPQFLYKFNNYNDLYYKILTNLNIPQKPFLLNQDLIDNFYANVVERMLT